MDGYSKSLGSRVLAVVLLLSAGAATATADAHAGSGRTEIDRKFQRGAGPKYCPGPGPVRPGRTRPGQWNVTRALVGKSLARAILVANRRDCVVRVVMRNGKSLATTDDLRYDRINLAVVKRSHEGKRYWKVRRIVDIA